MNRRQVLTTAALGSMGATLTSYAASAPGAAVSNSRPLQAPAAGKIPVAIVLSDPSQLIDFAGPWEVFAGVHVPGRGTTVEATMPFELFTVAPSTEPIRTNGGMRIVPDYAFADAPPAKVVVVPAQGGLAGDSGAAKDWLIEAGSKSDIVMSVCTGAFVLGDFGMLDGLSATTWFRAHDRFAARFPQVKLMRGIRFVENDKISTSAGLSAGIDLALRVVERYFGREIAAQTAATLEYEGKGWIV